MSDSLWPHGLLVQTHVHWISDAIQPSHPLWSHSPPAFIFLSIRVFSNESVLRIRWPKCWSFSITPSDEYTGLISFRIDWFDHLPVQGTLKSLLQHHSSKASILRRSAFFTFQLSHPYMTTGKDIALSRRTFAGKVISLLFNMLSRFVIVFLARSNLSYKNNTIIITLLVFRYVSQWNFGLVNRTLHLMSVTSSSIYLIL